MKILDFLTEDLIFVNEKFASREEALKFFATKLQDYGYASDALKALKLFKQRETEASTGIGNKIAMPHIRDEVMLQDKIFFAKVQPLEWEALDNQKVEYIFGIAMTAQGGENSHLEVISLLSKMLIDANFANKLAAIKTKEEFLSLVKSWQPQTEKDSESFSNNQAYDIVAVTACPTGIAHTFMAAERLIKAAQEAGLKIKVETQGTEGSKNVLTDQDIQNAKGVILAIDRAVDTTRFAEHENVLETSTRKAIHEPLNLFKKIENGEGIKLKNVNKGDSTSDEVQLSFNGFGKKAYRSIMTGVSYMLPFVIFGGILIALAFLIDLIHVSATSSLEAIDSSFGTMTVTSNFFMKFGGIAFGLMVPVLAAYITWAIVGKLGLLPGFLVGMIAVQNYNKEWSFIAQSLNLSSLGTDVSSGFFGAIFGAFFAAAMLIVIIKVFNKLGKNWQGISNILLIPLFGTAIIVITFFFLNIPFQYLNYGFTKLLNLIGVKPEIAFILGLIIGMMMGFDLGGPINKAAYVFGTISLTATLASSDAAKGSVAMAAAIVAGMVPPLAIAVSTLVSKKFWTDEEKKAAQTNWILGLSFISEGAIPFTAARPKVMVISNVVGGGVAGLVSAALGVGSLAPHGGIFIIPLFRSGLFTNPVTQIWTGILFMLLALVLGVIAQVITMHFLFKSEKKGTLQNKLFFKKRNVRA
ncbi:fructose-specific PTS transporter subunit EIIC [Mycoplasma iguanae]|uniref:Fructose-specific PTS transporter subunit EIIC n=1 Tax=Mycoplasma iguanae TaxID=292461 RepID=A0ABY5R7P7_9MOLU|nr:fructose-specific PTS transporter subunit EIIC [Mycoplasma iguanae]UVD81533.1 fructose-specific PTS transporter subunit EIIC [Mycoplasma iguanae]